MKTIPPHHRNTSTPLAKVYVSLVKELNGYCLEETIGNGGRFRDELDLRKYMNENYRKFWCSVYPASALKDLEASGMKVINEDQLLEKMADKGL